SVGSASLALALARTSRTGGWNLHSWFWVLAGELVIVAAATYGSVRSWLDPRRALGWTVAALGAVLAVAMLAHEYVVLALGRLPPIAGFYSENAQISQLASGTKWVALAESVALPALLAAAPFVV